MVFLGNMKGTGIPSGAESEDDMINARYGQVPDEVSTPVHGNRSNLTESRSFADAPSGLSATGETESSENSNTDEENETEPEEPMEPTESEDAPTEPTELDKPEIGGTGWWKSTAQACEIGLWVYRVVEKYCASV